MNTLRFIRFLLPLLALLSAVGCTSLKRTVKPDRNPAALQEIFVAANLNDNHGVARHLAIALRARGLRASSGPLTMLPASAQAVLSYDDRWSWDFGEHMTYLRLDLHDPGELQPYATATRTRFIARSTNLDLELPPLVAELLAPVKK
ncbi:MAG: hypothetical protein NTU80_14485 [Verrucomicrobia bacterium]|nr:hypothetical protein [Verrucomicrobiota bacterium]